ncbi:MAG: NAD(P)H-binding protein [Bacteroidetes bacterium]|nr:NAD(P)H-binding protein [Bacteroidota bacterium]
MHPATISILGCGWLGLPLARHLLEQGWTVRGSTTTPAKLETLAEAGIDPYLLTLDPEPRGEQVAAFFDADVLFVNVPPPRGADDLTQVVRAQTDAVLDAARQGGVAWILYVSSTSAYATLNRVVTEDDAYEGTPSRASGAALREAERLLFAADGIDTTVLRLAGLYGPDRAPGRFLAGRTGVSGPDAPVNMVHLADGIGVTTAVLREDARDALFNVCADEHPTRRAFYTQAARAQGLEPPTFSDAATDFKIVSNRTVRDHLGYTFEHPDPLRDVTFGDG